jgi:hypothetical protein
MKELTKHLRSALVTALGATVLVVAPVAAKGSDSPPTASTGINTSTTTTSETHDTSTSTIVATPPVTSTPQTVKTEHTETHSVSETEVRPEGADDTPKARAMQDLKAERSTKKEHSVEARQKTCAEHQTDINNRIDSLSRHAQKHLNDFNSVFAKVEAYQAKNKLSVASYDSLVASAVADQATTTRAISSLSSLTVTIDCTSPDPATAVATVKEAANEAKTSLQTYRGDIKAIIIALQAAKTAPTSDTNKTGSN